MQQIGFWPTVIALVATPAFAQVSEYQLVRLTSADQAPLSGAGCNFKRGNDVLFVTDYESGVLRLKFRRNSSYPFNLTTRFNGSRQVMFNPMDKRPQMTGFFSGGVGDFDVHIVPKSRLRSSGEEQSSAPATLTVQFNWTDTSSSTTTRRGERITATGIVSCYA